MCLLPFKEAEPVSSLSRISSGFLHFSQMKMAVTSTSTSAPLSTGQSTAKQFHTCSMVTAWLLMPSKLVPLQAYLSASSSRFRFQMCSSPQSQSPRTP